VSIPEWHSGATPDHPRIKKRHDRFAISVLLQEDGVEDEITEVLKGEDKDVHELAGEALS